MADESPNVTFVGGKAVEQNVPVGSNVPDDQYADAKAAVKAAMDAAKGLGEEAAKQAKEGRANDPFKPPGAKVTPEDEGIEGVDDVADEGEEESQAQETPAEEEEIDLTKASLKQVLKAREKAAKILQQSNKQAGDILSQANSEKEQVQRAWAQVTEAQEQVRRQLEQIRNFQRDPAAAIKAAGVDPEEFILNLAKEGTPEGKVERENRELKERLAKLEGRWTEEEQKRQEAQKRYQQQQIMAYRQEATKAFVNTAMNEEKYPLVSTIFKDNPQGLIALGDLTAEEYRNLTQKEGTYEEILDYLEEDFADKAKSWYNKVNGSQGKTANVQKPVVQSKKPTVKSKGKTLSPDISGERRALQPKKNLKDLDEDERKLVARQAVAAALANSADD